MEQTLVHVAEAAGWFLLIIFLFSIVGLIATIRWIVALVTGAERAVESGVENVENKFHGR